MDLNQLCNDINQNDKAKEVSNADMLAALILIQSRISKIENNIAENHKIQLKKYEEISNILATQDKNISAIPVLTANIISQKVNNVAAEINSSTNNIASATKALNESNLSFRSLIYAWIATIVVAFAIILYIVL